MSPVGPSKGPLPRKIFAVTRSLNLFISGYGVNLFGLNQGLIFKDKEENNSGMMNLLSFVPIVTFFMFANCHSSWAQEPSWKPLLAAEGDSILKQKSLLLEDKYFSSTHLRDLTEVLAKEMFSHFRILGIAAPQMNVSVRVFLLRSSFINPFNHSFEVYINPKITPVGNAMDSGLEFCLSTRGFHRIKRYKAIQLEFSKIDGTRKIITLSGSRARIAQHELDHLDGKLISVE